MKSLPLVKVNFIISSEKLDFDGVTSKLSIFPSGIVKKEDIKVKEFAKNLWMLFVDYTHTRCIDEPFERLIKSLRGKEKELLEIQRTYNAEFTFEVIIEMDEFKAPEILLPVEITRFIGSIGAELAFDMYPNMKGIFSRVKNYFGRWSKD